VTNGNVTGLADRLEADGLIRREVLDDDRRVTVARLTPLGRERFTEMARAHEGWIKELMSDVDEETLQLALEALARVKGSACRRVSAHEGDEPPPAQRRLSVSRGVSPKRAL